MGIQILIGPLSTINKGSVQGLEDLEIGGREETIQTTGLQKSAKILGRVQEPWGTCYYSDPSKKLSTHANVKNSESKTIIIIIIINRISPNSSTKQHHKNQSYQSENR